MKIDLHVHTCVSSPCSRIDPERMVLRAIETGLDAVCVTEHDEIEGAEVAREIGRRHGFPVFRGVEVFTDMGDMLTFGLYRDAPAWRVPLEELLELCGSTGAVLIPAHPCRVSGELERLHRPEKVEFLLMSVTALETHNGGCTPGGNRAALELAESRSLPGVGGSDAHFEFQVGRCLTIFDDDVATEEELIAALKAGRCRGAYPSELPGLGPH